MIPDLSTFGKFAESLSRNPLSIIALFIVLVYGIAGLVLGFAISDLDPIESLPLIWFLTLFPGVVLGVFAWLVAYHHTKLYSPGDFPDKDGFLNTLRAMTPLEQFEKRDAELHAVINEGDSESSDLLFAKKDNRLLSNHGLHQRALFAEEMVFRTLELEFGQPIRRNVAVQRSGQDSIPVDGIGVYGDDLIAIEILYTRGPNLLQLMIKAINSVNRINVAMPEAKAYIVVVYDNNQGDVTSDSIRKLETKFQEEIPRGQLRVFNLHELAREFGVTDSDNIANNKS